MTAPYKSNIRYHVSDSCSFLSEVKPQSLDLLYLDTGDMTPIEPTANLSLQEAKAIVERNILKNGALILIDDVRSVLPKRSGEKSDYGKAKYSLPYLLKHGYKIIMDEYQVILRKP